MFILEYSHKGSAFGGIRTGPSWSFAVVAVPRPNWSMLALAQNHRSRSYPTDSCQHFSAVVVRFLIPLSSFPFSMSIHCRLFSKMRYVKPRVKDKSFTDWSIVQLTVIFILILMVSPSLNPRSSWGLGSAFSFSSASAFFTYLK